LQRLRQRHTAVGLVQTVRLKFSRPYVGQETDLHRLAVFRFARHKGHAHTAHELVGFLQDQLFVLGPGRGPACCQQCADKLAPVFARGIVGREGQALPGAPKEFESKIARATSASTPKNVAGGNAQHRPTRFDLCKIANHDSNRPNRLRTVSPSDSTAAEVLSVAFLARRLPRLRHSIDRRSGRPAQGVWPEPLTSVATSDLPCLALQRCMLPRIFALG